MSRKQSKILSDINSSNMITRDDVLEFLDQFKTRDEAIAGLKTFLATTPDKAIKHSGDRSLGVERIISDIDSYKVWNENILN